MYDLNRTGLRKPLPYSYFHVSFWLIGINVLVFLLAPKIPVFSGQYSLSNFLPLNTGLINMGFDKAGLNKAGFGLWGIFTYMFVHGGFKHILFNMLALLIFGPALEKKMGSWEFLIYYLLTGTLVGGAALAVYLFFGMNTVLLGASGAIYAVLLGFATYYPTSKIYIWGIIPIKAPVLILIYLGIEIFGILQQVFSSSRGGTSHLGHLFGLLFGFLYLIARVGINPITTFFPKKQQNQTSNHFQQFKDNDKNRWR